MEINPDEGSRDGMGVYGDENQETQPCQPFCRFFMWFVSYTIFRFCKDGQGSGSASFERKQLKSYKACILRKRNIKLPPTSRFTTLRPCPGVIFSRGAVLAGRGTLNESILLHPAESRAHRAKNLQ